MSSLPPSPATTPLNHVTTPPSPAITPSRTASDAITTSTSNEETASTYSIKKHQLRAITRKAMNTKVSEDAVRRAIELYDLEKSYTEQPEEVMNEAEQILEMKEIQWPTPHYRRMMIFQKLSRSLRKVLASYGYVFFFSLLYAIEIC
jgi:hypothetical protein